MKAFARFLLLFAEGKRALGFSQTASSGTYAWISVGCPLFSLVKMPRGKIQFVLLKEVFSEWRKFQKGDRGLVLVEGEGGLRIEKRDRLDDKGKIFLGKVKKPTLKVGFLNALFQDERFLEKVKQNNLKDVLVPLPSRLRVNQIEKNFKVLEKLRDLKKLISLEISQIIKN